VNSIQNAKFISYSQQFYANIIVNKSILTPKMVLPHHAGKFLPKTKGFFPHDFTLIASVVGESVIGHGIVGRIFPSMAHLAKVRRWSKR
jgi:hypothetical protein